MSRIKDYEWDEEPLRELENELAHYLDYMTELVLDDPETAWEGESGEMFCGCEVCYTRETLAFLIPRIIDLWLNKKIRLQHVNTEVEGDLQLVQAGGDLEREGERSQ